MADTTARIETNDPPVAATNTWRPIWLVSGAGATVGLCILGDSLMYTILPLAASLLGLTDTMVGLLLSANRFVRLASNLWSSSLFERFGPRRPFLAATLLGVLSTALYGLAGGFALLFPARMMWGVAWSGLRQGGYVAVWTGSRAVKGRLTGYLWGLVRLGSATSVVVGGFLFDRYGYATTIWVITALSLLALPVALSIRWPAHTATDNTPPSNPRKQPARLDRSRWLSSVADALSTSEARWLIGASFFAYLLGGVVISTTGIFLQRQSGGNVDAIVLGIGIAGVTGMLHASRWLTDLALGPAAGYISDRVGQTTTALGLGSIQVASLATSLFVPPAVAVICLLLALMSDGMLHTVMSAAATGVATRTERPHIFVGVYTTLSDLGSAFGPLAAYTIGGHLGLGYFYLVCGVPMLFCMFQSWRFAPRRTGMAV